MRSLIFLLFFMIFLAGCHGEREAKPEPRPVGTTAGVNELYLEAVRQGQFAEVRKYLEERGAQVRAQDSLGNNALALAARSKAAQPELVRYLYKQMQGAVAQPAGVEVPDNRGRTPLSWAAGNGREDLLALYLEWGADVDRSDQFERTPLHYAAAAGESGTTKQLLTAGADANARDQFCETPLFAAGLKARVDVVKILLGSGAHAGLKDQEGRTIGERLSPERVKGSPQAADFAEIRAMLEPAAKNPPAQVTEKDGCE